MPTTDIVQDSPDVTETLKGIEAWFSDLGGWSGAGLLALKVVATLAVCLILKRILLGSFSHILERSKMERGLQRFLRSMLNILCWLIIIMVVAIAMGINPTPLVAAFSIVGLALSLAVQDSLANLAGGINILASRAFVVGDYIEIGEDSGTVHDVGMIHTTLQTPDNRRVVLPNSKVMSGRLINFSTEELRRVDIDFNASYDQPFVKVEEVTLAMARAQEQALTEPAPFLVVKKYGDSAIEYSLRVWCKQDIYWDFYFELMQKLKPTLDAGGIEMTYPHLNVHLRSETAKKTAD